MLDKARAWEATFSSYLSCSDVYRWKLGGVQEEDGLIFADQVEENGSADDSRKNRGHNLDEYELGYLRWSAWSMTKDPGNVTRWKHKFGFHNRGVQCDPPMSEWAGEGKAWTQLVTQEPPCKEDVTTSLLKMMRQPTEKKTQKGGSAMTKKPRDLEPLALEILAEDTKLKSGVTARQLWIGSMVRPNLLREWW